MPKTLQVSCVQLHWARALEFNLERTLHYIQTASANGSRVVLFPEANLTGYYFYREEMITAVLDLARADRAYVLASLKNPPFLAKYWRKMIQAVKARANTRPA
jgi:predicted amidohydrolase